MQNVYDAVLLMLMMAILLLIAFGSHESHTQAPVHHYHHNVQGEVPECPGDCNTMGKAGL